jgi:RNA polymerase sigma factor (sigma-70 family)
MKSVLDDKSRSDMIVALIPMARKIARKVSRNVHGIIKDEMMSAAFEGAVLAVERYDPAQGPLWAFAQASIWGFVSNEIRRLDPVPARHRQALRTPEKADERLLRKASLSVYEMGHVFSLDSPLPEDQHVAIAWDDDPGLVLAQRAATASLMSAIAQLLPNDRRVIQMHYYGGLTLVQIAQRLQLSPQRISQIHHHALQALKKRIAV